MGDSGTGKSALIRQILCQLEDRGDTAIVYDPALEYTPQFYDPARGDVILNPLDVRSPYWSPGDELRHDAEALTLATSLFPDRPERESVLHRRTSAHLCPPADVQADRRGAGLLVVPRGRARSTCPRDVVCGDDRPAGAGAAERRARLAQHGGGHAQAAAGRTRHDPAMERGGVVARAPGLAVPRRARRRRARGSSRSRACGWTCWCCG